MWRPPPRGRRRGNLRAACSHHSPLAMLLSTLALALALAGFGAPASAGPSTMCHHFPPMPCPGGVKCPLCGKPACLCPASPPPPSATTSKAQLDPFGTNGVRIRISAPGQPISEPITGALLPDPPEVRHGPATFDGPLSITHGNLKVVVDPATMFVTATRVSDGAVLLKQTNLSFVSATDPECNAPECKKSPWLDTCACNDQLTGARPGSVQAKVTFQGTAGELVYGLGEHKTHKVQQAPYKKTFADSLYYGMSRGGDVSIPYYSSSLGYGFSWNLPSLGDVSISEDAIEWSSYATLGVDMWISTTPAGSAPAVDAEVDPHRSFYLDLLHQWVDVSGHPTPMPFWTTGFIQCKDRYRNQARCYCTSTPPPRLLLLPLLPPPPPLLLLVNSQISTVVTSACAATTAVAGPGRRTWVHNAWVAD
eukprot:COSAG01_NODE_33_length_35013_cov_86.824144_8_plen_422_part_00